MYDEKYAVYVIIVPDTTEADLALAMDCVELERIGGNYDINEAELVMGGVPTDNYEMADAL